MRRFDLLDDESGMTLVELLVATAAGVVVMFGITLAVIVTTRETNRVASHVDANQRARLTMTRIINQLHSACVAPQIAPVQKDSTGTLLSFLHQSGSAVALTPVLSKISLTGTTLSQSDYPATGGAAPNWTFAATPSSTTQLMTNVSPVTAGAPIFTYYTYSNGQISSSPITVSEATAPSIAQVNVAFETAPQKTAIRGDAGEATEIQNSALLRLTPPAYGSNTTNLPCQ